MTGGVPAVGWESMALVRCAVVIRPHRRQRRCASVGTREAAASLDASSGTFVLTAVETIARVPVRERIPRGPRRSDQWIKQHGRGRPPLGTVLLLGCALC